MEILGRIVAVACKQGRGGGGFGERYLCELPTGVEARALDDEILLCGRDRRRTTVQGQTERVHAREPRR